MMKLNLLFSFCFFFITQLCSQNYEFYGVLKLNGKDEAAISYRLIFTENAGKIKGYSVTDITGNHETKNVVEGTYDAQKKILSFKEKDIVYTKSPISDDLFCFVNFEGKVKLNTSKPKMDGSFKGLFKNKSKCIDGTLSLVSSGTVNSLLVKANKRIQKSKELDEQTKKKYNPIQIFDSLQTNQLTTAQNLNVFNNSEKVSFEIWDSGIEDGDLINLYHNNVVILSNYTVTKNKRKIEVKLEKDKNVFKIEALNEGTTAPNTAMIVLEGDKSIEFQSNLKKGETAFVSIINGSGKNP